MDNYDELFNTICRVCLSYDTSGNMITLTDNASPDGLSCYGKAVHIFTNIDIKNDCLPNKMCQNCLFRLKQAIIFKQTCEKSYKKLLQLMRKFGVDDSEFKLKLNEYVMFASCFPDDYLFKTSVQKSVRQDTEKDDFSVTNESSFQMDIESDFEDLLSSNYHEETDLDPKRESNPIDEDELLDQMEKVVEMNPESLNLFRKKYPKNNLSLKFIKKRQKIKRNPRQNVDLQCKVCNKVLSNVHTYNSHMQRHDGGRYICEHCGKKYATYAELQYHLASTHDIGPQHICKECGFKAPKKYELMEHERLHTGERPYACDKCGLTFRRRFIWKKHALYHLEKTVQCPQCPRKFYQRNEMQAHANSVHERLYVYACSECDVTYAKTSTVRRHLVDKHGVARDMQGKIRRIILGKPGMRTNAV